MIKTCWTHASNTKRSAVIQQKCKYSMKQLFLKNKTSYHSIIFQWWIILQTITGGPNSCLLQDIWTRWCWNKGCHHLSSFTFGVHTFCFGFHGLSPLCRCRYVSLVGAATIIISVMTKVLSQQTCVCHGKTYLVATKVCLSQQQKMWCNKHIFVATKKCLSWKNFCCDKILFMKKIFCCNKQNFVASSILLSRQKMCSVATHM